MRLVVAAIMVAGLIAAPLAAQSRVVTAVDTALVTVGDRITLTVTVEHASGSQVVWPDSLDLAPFEVLGMRPDAPHETGGIARSTASFDLTAFELGRLEVPSFDVEVRGAGGEGEVLSTDRFVVEVVSVGADESGDIRDIRGPLGIPLGAWRIALWTLLPLLAVALLYTLARRLRAKNETKRTPVLAPPEAPAHEIALAALAELEASPLLERGEVKEYHIEVSDILRTYVERRFGVDALEMTTAEVVAGLRARNADADFIHGLRAFLDQCDLVKFAKVRPAPEASRQVLELGRRLVLQSAPRAGVVRYSAVSSVLEAGTALDRWTHRVPGLLRALALTALVLALARPQSGATTENVLTQGIDIVLVLDISTSMLAEDLQPNRLEAAKVVAADFVQGRRNDRIGLVAFAGEAFTQAPLTLDYGVVSTLVGELEPGMIEDGTAVGMGLVTALKRLEASDAASKVVILLTDGRSNRGEIGPLTAAQMAEALGVRVYTIGAGGIGTARVPVDDPLRGRVYATMRVDIDEESLRQMAELTGGRYFRATDSESLAAIYGEIDQLERTEIEVENFTQYTERFALLLGLGLVLVLVEVTLSQTVLRRLP